MTNSEDPSQTSLRSERRWKSNLSLNGIVSLSLAAILGVGYFGIKHETDRIRGQIAPIEEEVGKLYRREQKMTDELNGQLEAERKQAYAESAAMIARIEAGAKAQCAGAEEETRMMRKETKELGDRLDTLERGREGDKEVVKRKELEMIRSLQVLEKSLTELGGNVRKREEVLRIVEETLRKRYEQEQNAAMGIIGMINPLLKSDGFYIQTLFGVPILNKIIPWPEQKEANEKYGVIRVQAEGTYAQTLNDALNRLSLGDMIREMSHTKRCDGFLVYSTDVLDAIGRKMMSEGWCPLTDPNSLVDYDLRRKVNEEKGIEGKQGNESFAPERLMFDAVEIECTVETHRTTAENNFKRIFRDIDEKRGLGIGLYANIPEESGPLSERVKLLRSLKRDELNELYLKSAK